MADRSDTQQIPDESRRDNSRPEEAARSMPFLEHLEELRQRLLKSAVAVLITTCAAFYFSDELVRLMQFPLHGVPLYNTEVAGTFYAYLKISIMTGIFAAIPIIFYQMWKFISPGLYRREKTAVLPLVTASTALFIVGAGFCYLAVLPLATSYLLGFADEQITNLITVSSYLNYIGLMMLAFGLAFQLPILAYFLGKVGVVRAATLSRARRYAVVGIAIVAAIFTPPDVVSQLLLGVPMYLLYEISIVVVYLVQRKRLRREAEEETAETDRLPYGRTDDR